MLFDECRERADRGNFDSVGFEARSVVIAFGRGHGGGALPLPVGTMKPILMERLTSGPSSLWGAGCLLVGLCATLDGLALKALNFRDGEPHATSESSGGDFTLRTPAA